MIYMHIIKQAVAYLNFHTKNVSSRMRYNNISSIRIIGFSGRMPRAVVLDPSCFQSKCYSVGYLVVPSLPIVISLERKMNENVQNSTPFTGNIILLLYLRVKIPSSFKVISTLTKTSLKFYSDFSTLYI